MDGFTVNGHDTALTIDGFCEWCLRNHRNEALKSLLLEYVVGEAVTAVESADMTLYGRMRGNCLLDAYGHSVAVRYSGYVQADDPEHPDRILFETIRERSHPDVYVFGLCKAMDSSFMNLDIWDFYSISASRVHTYCASSVRITLPALLKLGPVWSDYNGIPDAINKAMGV